MNEKDFIDDKSTWAIGGGIVLGVGVGVFFLTISPLYFVGCILIGLGIGLIIAPIISKMKKTNTANEE